jgi:hypothetical protein
VKALNIAVNVVLICSAVLFSISAYLYFRTLNVTDIHSIEIVNRDNVVAGDDIIVKTTYSKYIDAPGIVTKTLIGPQTISLGTIKTSMPVGRNQSSTAYYSTPKTMTPGTYRVCSGYEYPTKNDADAMCSEEFEVRAK